MLYFFSFYIQNWSKVHYTKCHIKGFNLTAHLSEEVAHLELVLLLGQVGLDVGVGIVDDGKEHVEQDEEDEEDVEAEERRSEHAVRLLQSLEVEVAEDQTEQREAVEINHNQTLIRTPQ